LLENLAQSRQIGKNLFKQINKIIMRTKIIYNYVNAQLPYKKNGINDLKLKDITS